VKTDIGTVSCDYLTATCTSENLSGSFTQIY
jgi:hypothetical protein